MGTFKEWLLGPSEPTKPETREDSVPVGIIPPAYANHATANSRFLLRISSVSRSIAILSNLVSQLDMDTYDGDVIVSSPAIVKRPDPNMPRKFFIQQTVTDMALHGEAFWKLVKNGQGIPNNLELLDPTTVIISKVNGRIVYSQNNKVISNVSHLKLGRFSGELHGLGPLQLSTSDLELALMLEKYALTQFDSDAIPRGQLSTTMELSADDLEDLVVGVKKFIADNGGILALPYGLKYDSIVGDPARTQFIEVQKMVDLKIARAFGVPPEALSMSIDSNSMTYQNVAQSNIRTLQQTLNRYMDEIEEQLSDLLPGNKHVRFREEDLMRLDLLGKWQMIEAQVRVGYTSGDELREAEGKKPLPKPAIEPDKQPFQKKADDEN